jgi:hypothetical protein
MACVSNTQFASNGRSRPIQKEGRSTNSAEEHSVLDTGFEREGETADTGRSASLRGI